MIALFALIIRPSAESQSPDSPRLNSEEILPVAPQEMDSFDGKIQPSFGPTKSKAFSSQLMQKQKRKLKPKVKKKRKSQNIRKFKKHKKRPRKTVRSKVNSKQKKYSQMSKKKKKQFRKSSRKNRLRKPASK